MDRDGPSILSIAGSSGRPVGEAMIDSSRFPILGRESDPDLAGGLACRPVRVKDAVFGGPVPVVIAGPCSVESREQTLAIARAVKRAGADLLRGGAFKPRTSPHSFQGLGRRGLEILAEAREETGLPVVTEVLDIRTVELVAEHADILQVGSRSMHCSPLLREVGMAGKPVLLKRGMSATLTEWIAAAEYVALGGSRDIILCERGVRCPAGDEYARNLLDLNVVIPARRACTLPVIVDPSHGTGDAELVPWAARAAIAAGAQGLIIEVIDEETDVSTVRCDGKQSIRPSVLRQIVADVKGPVAVTGG